MSAKSRNIKSDLKKVDGVPLTSADYEELPELNDEFFERADEYQGSRLIRRGRPPAENPKVLLSVRYSQEVVDYFRSTGPGWQSRMNQALKEWIDSQGGRPTK